MARSLLLPVLAALACAPPAEAAPDGVPARPMAIGSWGYHDPVSPRDGLEPWTAADVAGFLELHPAAYLELAYEDGKPPGNKTWRDRGRMVDELRAVATQRGVDVAGRLCMSERPDVLTRLVPNGGSCLPPGGGGCDWEGGMNGRFGEQETVVKSTGSATGGAPDALADGRRRWDPGILVNRLLVLRPRSASEERRRVVSNEESLLVVDRAWAAPPRPGDAYEIRGSFDPSWVMRAPRSVHEATMQRFWTNRSCGPLPCLAAAEPLDVFAAANRRGWEPWVDRAAIESLATASSVPALYGSIVDAGTDPTRIEDPFYRTSGVVLDLANAAYRAWRARYLLYKLADHGFAPGEPVCLLVSYKPGWHTFHDESVKGPGNVSCSEPGTNMWTGPAHVCSDGNLWGGPLHPTQFAAGAYEAGVSAYFREMLALLASSGYADVRVITTEAPRYEDRIWSILADDVRRHPNMEGERGGWIDPPLAALAALSAAPEPDGGASEPPAGDGAAPAPTGGEPAPASPPASPAPPTDTEPTSPGTTAGGPASVTAPATGGDTNPPASTSGSLGTGGGSPGAGGGPSATGAATRQPAARSDEREPRRGYMTSGGGGAAQGTVEPPGAE